MKCRHESCKILGICCNAYCRVTGNLINQPRAAERSKELPASENMQTEAAHSSERDGGKEMREDLHQRGGFLGLLPGRLDGGVGRAGS